MNIIELTDSRRGGKIFVNVKAISYFQQIDLTSKYTQLFMIDNPVVLKIEETPNEIIEIIKNTRAI